MQRMHTCIFKNIQYIQIRELVYVYRCKQMDLKYFQLNIQCIIVFTLRIHSNGKNRNNYYNVNIPVI